MSGRDKYTPHQSGSKGFLPFPAKGGACEISAWEYAMRIKNAMTAHGVFCWQQS